MTPGIASPQSERAMTDPSSPALAHATPPESTVRGEVRETLSFLLKLVIAIAVLRSFIFSPFNIPSQSMLPSLYVGDYLFVSKWNYGFSRYSLPFGAPLIRGRIFSRLPERGDVVVFKAPPGNSEDWIKRVIGLPGDTIQMRHGQLILNGVAVPHVRVADFVIPISPNYSTVPDARTGEIACPAPFLMTQGGKQVCRYHQYRETLPNGRSYMTLDRGTTRADDTGVYTVPAGHVFLMGDNRDDSEDSRFSTSEGGISYVPVVNIEGKASYRFWSTDGSAWWILPWTWFSSARFGRIGSNI